jgi:hypothetical protein
MAVAVTPATNDRGFQPRSLDAVNFLLADVRGALGPYLNVFLVTQQHWSQSEVGDSYHPLPWQSLTYDEVQGGYVVDLDRSRLEGAPSYKSSDPDRWADPAYRRQVNDYYGI